MAKEQAGSSHTAASFYTLATRGWPCHNPKIKIHTYHTDLFINCSILIQVGRIVLTAVCVHS